MADYNITAVTRRVVYTGSAGVGPYAFTFPVISQTDIAVYQNSTKLILTTDYTVTVSSANGTGSVTLVVAATGADRIVIIGARAIERTTDFVTAGDLKASSLNEQLDASIIMIQQLAEENKRTLKAPQFDPAAVEDGGTLSMVLPVSTSRAGKLLAFDTDGNPVAGEDIGNWRGNWAASVAFVVRDLVKDGSNSNVYRVNTAHTSSGTTPISSNADVAKFDLVVDAAASAASAAAAAASASAASSSASAASTSASNASTSATNSSTSASNSSTSASAAAASAAAAAASFDAFDDIYLGAYATNPTLDNDGNALTTGDQYFNTTANELRVWNGSSWQAASTVGGTIATLNVTGVASFADGSAALPSITNDGNTNTGIFFPAADTIAFTEGGTEAMRINSSGQIETKAGTAALPAITTTGDTNTGIFFPSADTIAISTGGTERTRVSSAGVALNGSTSGSVTITAPAVAGTTTLTLPATTGTFNTSGAVNEVPAGSVSAPSIYSTGDTNTGIFFPAADTIAFAEGGVEAMRINSSGQAEFTAGTAALPAITSTGDTNTGIFFSTADTIDFAEGGTATGQFDSSGNFKFNSGYGSVATAYGVRAWVNFNGTGTVAIRASGNVSSITDNGTGSYTINFTTAMPDANYSVDASSSPTGSNPSQVLMFASITPWATSSPAASNFTIATVINSLAYTDIPFICLSVSR